MKAGWLPPSLLCSNNILRMVGQNIAIFCDMTNTTSILMYVKFQSHMSNATTVMNASGMMGQTGLG